MSSRTIDAVQGNARLAQASIGEEVETAISQTDKDVAIGGATLASAAIGLGLVDEFRMFRNPVIVGGGTPFLPPVTEAISLVRNVRFARDSRALPTRRLGPDEKPNA
ncbi:MAG: dihydrofolate reductase family protein [Candidatus Nanopelagicales bacterium]|nr:dihydrofolate reductase family protein [Candidatus Nanopelagicales bacterium]